MRDRDDLTAMLFIYSLFVMKIETVTRLSLLFLVDSSFSNISFLIFFIVSFLRISFFLYVYIYIYNRKSLVRDGMYFVHRNEILAKDFFKKKKRLPQDCGTKRMKHNSVAKLPRLALQLILLLPSSSETRLLREMVQQKRKRKKRGKKELFP